MRPFFMRMKEWAEPFYHGMAWRRTRKAYKQSVGGLCEVCKAKGLIRPGVIVHHKTWLTRENIKNPDITLNWDNLQLVCRDCHAEIHKDPKRYTIDEMGRVIPR